MTKRVTAKLLREGDYAAEVDVELIDSDVGWAPYLSLEDANKLDEVRMALRREDLQKAAKLGRLYKLTPLAG
jgi:hypothetical protein